MDCVAPETRGVVVEGRERKAREMRPEIDRAICRIRRAQRQKMELGLWGRRRGEVPRGPFPRAASPLPKIGGEKPAPIHLAALFTTHPDFIPSPPPRLATLVVIFWRKTLKTRAQRHE